MLMLPFSKQVCRWLSNHCPCLFPVSPAHTTRIDYSAHTHARVRGRPTRYLRRASSAFLARTSLLLPSSSSSSWSGFSPDADALFSASAGSPFLGDANSDLIPPGVTDCDTCSDFVAAEVDGEEDDDDDDEDPAADDADFDLRCDFVEASGSPRATALMRWSSANDFFKMSFCFCDVSFEARRA